MLSGDSALALMCDIFVESCRFSLDAKATS
jgi:hypothetical protein